MRSIGVTVSSFAHDAWRTGDTVR